MAQSRPHARRGQALIMVTLSLFMLFGMMGLAVDVGWSYYRKQVAQTASDAAALAAAAVARTSTGASVLTCGQSGVLCQMATACPDVTGTPANNLENGCLYAKANGFTNSGNQTVTIEASAAGVAPDPAKFTVLYAVTVTTGESNPQLFSAVAGHRFGQVTARSTAQVVQLPSPYCIYALNPTAGQSVLVTGSNSFLKSPQCGIGIDSNNSAAFTTSGNAQVQAAFIKTAPIADPLLQLPEPPLPAACDQVNFNRSQAGQWTLAPGVYCGGINISGQTDVTFAPGIYYIYGGGVNIQNMGRDTGSGVMFFNADGHGAAGLPTFNYAPVLLGGQANITLTAAMTGPYASILFFKSRSTGSNGATDVIQAAANADLTGTLYLPGDNFLLNGAGLVNIYIGLNNPAVVADTITVGGGTLDVQVGTGGSSPLVFAALTR